MAIAPYGYSQELWNELSPEAKAVVERPESQRLGRAQDTRDFLGDDIQTFEKLGETGSSWGGKQITYQAYDAQGRPTEKFAVDESGLQKGLQIAAQMAASMIPMAGAGAAIGAAMGIPAQYAAHFGNALLSGGMSALSGGNFVKGAVAGGLGSYASPYISEFAKTAGQAVGGDALGKIVSGAVEGAGRSAVGAAATESNIVDALLSGAVGGATSAGTDILVKGTNSTLNEYLKDVPAPVRNAVTSAATAGLLGKDPDRAAINAFIGTLTKSTDSPFKPAAKTTDATTQQLLDAFGTPQDTGRMLGQVAGDIPSGMFDTDEGVIIPDWDVLPDAKPTFTPGSDDVYEDIESLLARYEDKGFTDQPSGATDQSIDITGSKDAIIPDWDVLPDVVTTPRSIRDIGTITKIDPGETLDIPALPVPDLSVGLQPAVPGGTKTTPAKPAGPAAQDDWLRRLAFLLGANRPQDKEKQPYQLADMPEYEDLAYGFSGETPYMRG